MANKYRGEIDAIFDGRPHKLCLTLGALAELESAFGDADMLALAQRFSDGRLKASDAVRIIGAGLRGAGLKIADEAVAQLQADGGAAGFVGVVAQLLQATFGVAEASPLASPRGNADPSLALHSTAAAPVGVGASDPFPGTR
jgi:Phage tail tube protein, GTA-gp10